MTKDGILYVSPAQQKIMDAYLKNHDGDYIRMEYSQPVKGRSSNQNKYYWGVIMTMIAAETGHTTEEIHEYCKAKFLPRIFLKIGNEEQELTKSTTTLSTMDMEDYHERIRSFAATELNITIPLPNEC